MRPKLKSERHHWWPECLSRHWDDAEGGSHWLLPDGAERRAPAKNFGVIGNGHHIKLSGVPGVDTVWDESFETEFQRADDLFPSVIEWLDKLPRDSQPGSSALSRRFMSVEGSEEQFRAFTECLVSLVLRSPMSRESAVAVAEHFRGPLPERERNSLIGANLRRKQRMVADSLGSRGKFAVVYSPDREFIFGDGFFHNVVGLTVAPMNPKIVAPLTPRITAIYARPMQYSAEPKLSTITITRKEADRFNHAVQVYARNALFYRTDRPEVDDAFRSAKHLQYESPDNPIDSFIRTIPGVPDRDRSMDYFLGIR